MLQPLEFLVIVVMAAVEQIISLCSCCTLSCRHRHCFHSQLAQLVAWLEDDEHDTTNQYMVFAYHPKNLFLQSAICIGYYVNPNYKLKYPATFTRPELLEAFHFWILYAKKEEKLK